MSGRSKSISAAGVLALSLAFMTVDVLHAQDPRGTIQIDPGWSPRWTEVGGTRVYVIADPGRPHYDMFRHDGRYYVYRDDRWYVSRQWRGAFTPLEAHAVPEALMRVPRERWVRYPAAWARKDAKYDRQDRYDRDGRHVPGARYDRSDRGSRRSSGTLRVALAARPDWTMVPGTGVYRIRSGTRPPYDMFRFGDTFYVYDSERWYSSGRWNGMFSHIDGRAVPAELARVPRRYWRDYPEAWAHEYRDRRPSRSDGGDRP